jgi:hypothetical protein
MRVPFIYMHKNGLPNLDVALSDLDFCAEMYKSQGVKYNYIITIGEDNIIVLFTLTKQII